jgi:hypothetical protein
MENVADYSEYVIAAYMVVGLVLFALMGFVLVKFFAGNRK